MTDTFAWVPMVDPTGTTTFDVLSAQFGDGYSQAVPNGLNNASDNWPVSFIGKAATIAPIEAFLRAHAGATSFYWTPPGGSQGLFRCATFTKQAMENGIYMLTATMQQVFAP